MIEHVGTSRSEEMRSVGGLSRILSKTTWHFAGGKCFFLAMLRKHVILLMAEILHQLIGSLSHYLQGFRHPRWCRISAINSMFSEIFTREVFEKKKLPLTDSML